MHSHTTSPEMPRRRSWPVGNGRRPSSTVTGPDPSYGLELASRIFQRVGLSECWAYHDALSGRWHGPASRRVAVVFRTADLLLNLSGSNVLRSWALIVPSRVYVDTD